jgi:PD-(D/E)XK nuclease superfamily
VSKSLVAWSYSRLESLETCPRKFYRISIKKDVLDPPNEHTTFGDDLHKAFAKYLTKGTPLPISIRHHTPMLAKVKAAPGDHIVEQQVAINANYIQTGWFDKDVYCRVISDITIMRPPNAVMIDWKTGKPKSDFTQLRVAAAVMFMIAPELETISLSFAWLKTKEWATERMTRDEMPDVWAALHPRLVTYQAAFDNDAFPPRPGFHCRYCPDKSCQYNENKK